jgi:hypothetical protein
MAARQQIGMQTRKSVHPLTGWWQGASVTCRVCLIQHVPQCRQPPVAEGEAQELSLHKAGLRCQLPY